MKHIARFDKSRLLVILFCFPALAVIKSYRLDVVWLVTSIAIAVGFMQALKSRFGPFRLAARSALLVIACLNLLYMASVAIQGQGFNDAFFYHLDPSVLFSDPRIYLLLSSCCAFLIGIWALTRKLGPSNGRGSHSRTFVSFLVLATGTIAFPPLVSVSTHVWKISHVDTHVVKLLDERLSEEAHPVKPLVARNLVLIYMESLERSYFLGKTHPDMMPNLSAIAARSINFTNLRQMPNTGWTMGGIVSSQCGIPLMGRYGFELNELGSAMPRFMPRARCLGDVLKENGYALSFFNAADVRFGGKGAFLREHGYDTVVGRGVIDKQIADADKHEGWGIHDDILFPIVEKHYADAVSDWQRTGQPFVVSLLTVDNHPNFDMLSKSCGNYGAGVDLYNAAHCSDQTIGRFIQRIRSMPGSENTVIVAMSDHLNFTLEALKRFGPETNRRLTLMINEPDGEHRAVDSMGTHFDVGPTILDALGFTGDTNIGMGQSLLRAPQGFLPASFPPDILESVVNSKQVKDFVDSRWDTTVARAAPIVVEPTSVTLGEQRFTVAPFEDLGIINYFLITFDEKGGVTDISSYLTQSAFASAVFMQRNRVVLALAPSAGLSKVFGTPDYSNRKGAYFFGKPSAAGISSGPVEPGVTLSQADVARAEAQKSNKGVYTLLDRVLTAMF